MRRNLQPPRQARVQLGLELGADLPAADFGAVRVGALAVSDVDPPAPNHLRVLHANGLAFGGAPVPGNLVLVLQCQIVF